ncbi:TonB-dependent vitamin B12 receptor [Sphingobacterium griseoflavum]|uniref:TonB-dependent vitamin B12 receptor n=2 Tax=Sphingobacterium griseoflavum TaxID=1474952 RepID=A0ABQ3HZ65_9SPHI|nr:TonB-dependent vitamin B12 receptor [Sphingobacterium griseoflavum]
MPFAEQSRNIQLLDRKQIEALPVRSVNELLSYIPGVDLRQRGPFGAQADVSVDGGSFEQTLVLLNGVKMLDAQTGHNMLNLPVQLDAIERIEVIRGPAARLYGINALTGAINIVTRKPVNSELLGHVYTGTGFKRDTANNDALFHTRGIQLGGTWINAFGRHSLYGSHESGNGYRYNTASRNNKLFYEADIPTRGQDGFSIMGGFVESDFGANGFYAAPGDKESQEIVQTLMGSVGYQAHISERFRISPRVSYRYGYDDYRYFRHDLSRARSQHYTHALNSEVNAVLKTDVGDLGMGIEMRNEQIRSSNIGNHARDNYGMYAEFKTDRINRLMLNLGAYVNYNSDYGWQVFPGIDIGFALTNNWQLTAHSGTGQRIPSFTDLYLDQRPGNIGNPTVRPEEAWYIEGGIKYNDGRLFGQAHYFYRDINNFIDWVRPAAGTPYQPLNFNGNKVHGATALINYQLSNPEAFVSWFAGLSYTHLWPSVATQEGTTSKYAVESLRQQIIGNIRAGIGKLSASAALRFNERISYKNYFLADARMAYRLKPMELYLDVQNMFDITYIEAAAVPMPGRWFSLGARFNMPLDK